MNKVQVFYRIQWGFGEEGKMGSDRLYPGICRAVRVRKVVFHGYKHLSVFINILVEQEN